MFFFYTLDNAFPTCHHIKTIFSGSGLKPTNNACLLNLVHSASFPTQGNWLEKKANQSLCIRKEALGIRG